MKTKILLFGMAIGLSLGSLQAQTSYGNLNQGTAGDNGGVSSTYFGHQAGLNNTALGSTFIGYRSGESNTTGFSNTFLGYQTGFVNTGNANTFLGNASGFDNTTGSGNLFLGSASGYNNVSGNSNTIVGTGSGQGIINTSNNVFLGYYAGLSATGSDNVFLGYQAGRNSDGSDNVFIGYQAGYSEDGSNLLYIDNSGTSSPLIWGDFATNALRFNGTVRITDIPQNNALTHVLVEDADGDIHWRDAATLGGGGGGTDDQQINLVGNQLQLEDGGNVDLSSYLDNTDSQNLNFNDITHILSITGGNNVDLSSLAGGGGGTPHNFPSYPDSAGDTGGTTNSFFGHLAGSVNTGADNTLVGFQSGLNNTTGYENSSLGSRTLENNTTGSRNTANGVFTLFGNTTGIENTAVGYAALGFNTTGNGNTATGYQALLNSNNSNNTAMGYQSGIGTTTGANNTYIGQRSGYTNQTGSGNVFLGNQAGYNETGSNRLYIDNSNTSSPLIWGDFATDALQFNGNVSISNIPQDDALTRVLVADNNGNVNWRAAASLGAAGGTDDQQLSLIGNQLQLEDGGNVDLAPYLDNTDAQTLNFDGGTNILSITGGNNVDLSSLAGGGGGGTPHDFPSYPDSAGDAGGNTNTYFGHEAGVNNTSGSNTFIGYQSGYDHSTGSSNTYIGRRSGYNNQTGSGNIFIGYNAGYNELNSNRLYVDNSSTSAPLIWGDFSNNELRFNGTLAIGNGQAPVAGYHLTVGGDIIADKVKVAVNGSANWSDYVFEDNYDLKPLAEVETFIKENKHLPNIPGADEVVKNGLDLGQMDARLLEKIEELTLYVIEINKKVEKLEAENTRLRSAVINPKQ